MAMPITSPYGVQDRARDEEIQERQWQDALPAEPHELVVAETRQGPPYPDEQPQEEQRLGREGAHLEERRRDRTHHLPQSLARDPRNLPAAEEERDDQHRSG